MQKVEELQRASDSPGSNTPENREDGRVGRVSRNTEIAVIIPKIIDGHSAGKSIRQLARENEISKNTVRSIIKNPDFPLPAKEGDNKVENKVENLPKQTQELPPVPEKPQHGNNVGIGRYYKVNTPQIIKEIEVFGLDATKERWQFHQMSWYRFCKLNNIKLPRGGYKPRHHNYPAHRKPAVKETVKNKRKSVTHGTYVSFPPFNDKWAPEVQVKWLEIYPQLAKALNEGPGD